MTRLHLLNFFPLMFLRARDDESCFIFSFLTKQLTSIRIWTFSKKKNGIQERAAISANNQKDDRATFSCASARNRARKVKKTAWNKSCNTLCDRARKNLCASARKRARICSSANNFYMCKCAIYHMRVKRLSFLHFRRWNKRTISERTLYLYVFRMRAQ